MTRPLLWQSFWVRGAAWTLVTLAFAFTSVPALFGRTHWDIVPALGGSVGAAVATLMRLADFRKLSLADRARVETAMRDGRPTGDSVIDGIARDRLVTAARSQRTSRIVFTIIGAIVLAFSLVAAFRVDVRFLFALIPEVLALCSAARVLTWEQPLVRLARFDELLAQAHSDQAGPTAEIS